MKVTFATPPVFQAEHPGRLPISSGGVSASPCSSPTLFAASYSKKLPNKLKYSRGKGITTCSYATYVCLNLTSMQLRYTWQHAGMVNIGKVINMTSTSKILSSPSARRSERCSCQPLGSTLTRGVQPHESRWPREDVSLRSCGLPDSGICNAEPILLSLPLGL